MNENYKEFIESILVSISKSEINSKLRNDCEKLICEIEIDLKKICNSYINIDNYALISRGSFGRKLDFSFCSDLDLILIYQNHYNKKDINNFTFFATNHRPDSVFTIDKEFRVAIEIKKGDSGSALRARIGQALVYSTQFDFVIYFFIDISPGFDIKSAYSGKKEKKLINSLWHDHNIKFKVV